MPGPTATARPKGGANSKKSVPHANAGVASAQAKARLEERAVMSMIDAAAQVSKCSSERCLKQTVQCEKENKDAIVRLTRDVQAGKPIPSKQQVLDAALARCASLTRCRLSKCRQQMRAGLDATASMVGARCAATSDLDVCQTHARVQSHLKKGAPTEKEVHAVGLEMTRLKSVPVGAMAGSRRRADKPPSVGTRSVAGTKFRPL